MNLDDSMFGLFNQKNIAEQLKSLAPVARTRTLTGRAVPAFIHNQSYFYTDLEVYEDGVINCWEAVDLDGFLKKLRKGWVTTSVPDGQFISIHHLGGWEVRDGRWDYDRRQFFKKIWKTIRTMNPEMINLYRPVEKFVGNVRHLESADGRFYDERKRFDGDSFPDKVYGEGVHLFYKNELEYSLSRVTIFPDESIVVTGAGEPRSLTLSALQNLVREGTFMTELPPNASVRIADLGIFRAARVRYVISIDDKLLELSDLVEQLNKRPTSTELCRAIFQKYLKFPAVELRKELKNAYEQIPSHMRRYVGDMDTGDVPVRMIIYGEQEIENWSHYRAAKEAGDQLPSISISRRDDERES